MPLELNDLLDGLDESTVSKVVDTIKENADKKSAKVFIDGEGSHFVPKSRLDTVISERDTFKSAVEQSKAQLEELKKANSGDGGSSEVVESLNAQVAQLEGLVRKATVESKLSQLANDSLAPVSDLLNFIDQEKVVTASDGNVLGLDEQLAELRENKPYLFKSPETDPKGTGSLGGPSRHASGNPKVVGSIGKKLAEQAYSNTSITENPFFK